MIVEVLRRGHTQRLDYDDFERRVRDGEIAPDVLVRVEGITEDQFRPAGSLELYGPLANPEPRNFRARLLQPGLPMATAILVGVQIQIYLASMLPGVGQWMQSNLASWTPAVLEEGQIWRLFTYGLLHLSFTHILFNLLFLAYTGYHLERALGRANLLLIYFGAVFVGGIFSMSGGPERFSLGASGGIFGLLGAAVVFGVKYRDALPPRARRYFGFAIAPYPIGSMLMSLSNEGVDNWCHLGGLLTGLVLGAALEPVLFAAGAKRDRWVHRLGWGAMVAVTAFLTLRGPTMVPIDPLKPPDVEGTGLTGGRPSWWTRRTLLTGEPGWGLPSRDVELSLNAVIRTTPRATEAAADELVARFSSATTVDAVERTETTLDGVNGYRLHIRYRHRDITRALSALVFTRGIYEYSVWFSVPNADEARYEVLRDRILNSVHIAPPDELRLAHARVDLFPALWAPWSDLGLALNHTGDPKGALQAYDESLKRSPEEGRPLAGRLGVYTTWQLPGAETEARAALEIAPLAPEVVVAAAEALSAAGFADEGIAALDNAWDALPGDRTLRRARERWALDTAIPQPKTQPRSGRRSGGR